MDKGQALAMGQVSSMGEALAMGQVSPRGQALAMGQALTKVQVPYRGEALARGQALDRGQALARGQVPYRGQALAMGKVPPRGQVPLSVQALSGAGSVAVLSPAIENPVPPSSEKITARTIIQALCIGPRLAACISAQELFISPWSPFDQAGN